jgi:signal transduction histidine kinase
VSVIRRVLDGLMVEVRSTAVYSPTESDEDYVVVADPDKLAQALINLLANAYRYSSKGRAD